MIPAKQIQQRSAHGGESARDPFRRWSWILGRIGRVEEHGVENGRQDHAARARAVASGPAGRPKNCAMIALNKQSRPQPTLGRSAGALPKRTSTPVASCVATSGTASTARAVDPNAHEGVVSSGECVSNMMSCSCAARGYVRVRRCRCAFKGALDGRDHQDEKRRRRARARPRRSSGRRRAARRRRRSSPAQHFADARVSAPALAAPVVHTKGSNERLTCHARATSRQPPGFSSSVRRLLKAATVLRVFMRGFEERPRCYRRPCRHMSAPHNAYRARQGPPSLVSQASTRAQA